MAAPMRNPTMSQTRMATQTRKRATGMRLTMMLVTLRMVRVLLMMMILRMVMQANRIPQVKNSVTMPKMNWKNSRKK